MTEQTELGVLQTENATDTTAVELHAGGMERLIALAIEKDGAVDVIERLAALHERELDRDAEQRFMSAFAEFRSRCPAIPRNKRGAEFAGKGGVKSHVMYAPLDTIQEVVDPILHSVGLSYWWSSEATDDRIITHCHLRHVAGHERVSAMSLPVTGPPKSSATQAHAGTRSFAKRLTLSDVLGIQTTDDVDGADGGDVETISEYQVKELQELIVKADRSEETVLEFAQVDKLEDIPVGRYALIERTLRARAAQAVLESEG